jgi:hypothetical protein
LRELQDQALVVGEVSYDVRARASALVEELGIVPSVLDEVRAAYAESPVGFVRMAEDALRRDSHGTPAALFMAMLRAGEHLRAPSESKAKVTGWRWVRAIAAGPYVRDPLGTDVPPPGWDENEYLHPPAVVPGEGPVVFEDGSRPVDQLGPQLLTFEEWKASESEETI